MRRLTSALVRNVKAQGAETEGTVQYRWKAHDGYRYPQFCSAGGIGTEVVLLKTCARS